jgi:inorganic pyrophosphatase
LSGLSYTVQYRTITYNNVSGFLPQTWEDPNYDDDSVFGDNDPVDVVDIGDTIHNTGDIVKVKVLGALALLDQGT